MTTPSELVTARQTGFGLDGRCYSDAALFCLELECIWRREWLFAAHSCELATAGDYLALNLAGEPVVVARTSDGAVRAFFNVCRHRGSLIAQAGPGHGRHLVCPYHQWSYGLDGGLVTCPGAGEGFERERWPLLPLRVEETGGLIFICFANEAPPFEHAARDLAAGTEQGFEDARIAHRRVYDVAANWKLILENNRECLHCAVNHPEYVRANFDRFVPGAATSVAAQLSTRVATLGVEASDLLERPGLAPFPDPEGKQWWSSTHTVLQSDFSTESLDGHRVAPRLATEGADHELTLRLRTLPNFWCHASVDHAVTTSLSPLSPTSTRVVVSWLVHRDARSGVDFDLDRLVPFWQLTSEQDWEICERQQRGVDSSGFRPGPLSAEAEANVESLLVWYSRRLAGTLD